MDQLLTQLHRLLISGAGVVRYHLFIWQEGEGLVSVSAHPDGANLKPGNSVLRLLESRSSPVLSAAELESMRDEEHFSNTIREFELFKADHCFRVGPAGHASGVLWVAWDRAEPTPQTLASIELAATCIGMVYSGRQGARDHDVPGKISPALAHDLQSRFTPISALLQFCRDPVRHCDDIRDLEPQAMLNLEAAQNYIRDALVTQRRRDIEFATFNMRDLLRRVTQIAHFEAVAKLLQLEVRCDAGLRVSGAPLLIERLFLNLVLNAISASPTGSTIVLQCHDHSHDHDHDHAGGNAAKGIRVRITDSGPGFEPGVLRETPPSEFGVPPGHSTPRRTGLGLIICQRIVELHRGSLQVISGTGPGAVVEVLLPSASSVDQPPG